MDKLTASQRSAIMARVKTKGSKPELQVRSALHRLGYRYRLHCEELPGRPDLVFPAKKKVIFVHGCFWHGHYCPRGKLPATNVEFWKTKICKNRKRDAKLLEQLQTLGWDAEIIWECEIRSDKQFLVKLTHFLNARPEHSIEIKK